MILPRLLDLRPNRNIFGDLSDILTADLLITSPPLKFLADEVVREALVSALVNLIHKDGYLLIDMPVEKTKPMTDILSAFEWMPLHPPYFIKNMYPGIDQNIGVFVHKAALHPVDDFLLLYQSGATLNNYRANDLRGHICEFERPLIEKLIGLYSEPGHIVVDPMCGTGTVPRAAVQLRRYGIGLDIRSSDRKGV